MHKFNPDIHHRRSIRLKNYDYSQAGAYFVTVCAWRRECLFGDIKDGEMRLNEFGRVAENEWLKTVDIRNNVELDYYIVMPNHFHGIVIINDVGAIHELPLQNKLPIENQKQRRKMLLPMMIGRFKMNSAKQINKLRDNPGCPVWQRNYHERIIRNDDELNRIREYIMYNPAGWAEDENNPINIK